MDVTWLRHYLSVLDFRLRHALHGAPASYWTFRAGSEVKPPLALLHHIAEMVLWVASRFLDDPDGELPAYLGDWKEQQAGTPAFELAHIARGLRTIDAALRDGREPGGELDLSALFRGPLADSLTHVGQLAMLRRLAGSPVADAEFWAADTGPGKLGG